MKPISPPKTRIAHEFRKGFTLMETVIAIGVLAVLLTGFIAVFTPAAQGIRRSISAQQADRLATTLEQELVTLRKDQEDSTITTGFEKAFDWIKNGGSNASEAIFVYQYRGDPTDIRPDGTPVPLPSINGQPGKDYVVQLMARRASEKTELEKDLKAIEGTIFYVKPIQLIYKNNSMELSKESGKIMNPTEPTEEASNATSYKDAVIAFSAEFYSVPSKSYDGYLNNDKFKKSTTGRFYTAKRPVFTRNLAVRR